MVNQENEPLETLADFKQETLLSDRNAEESNSPDVASNLSTEAKMRQFSELDETTVVTKDWKIQQKLDDNYETIKVAVINREKVSRNFYHYFNVRGEDSLMWNINLERVKNLKQFDSYENVNDEGQYKILSRGVYCCKGDEVKAQLVAKLFEEKKEVPSDFPTVTSVP